MTTTTKTTTKEFIQDVFALFALFAFCGTFFAAYAYSAGLIG